MEYPLLSHHVINFVTFIYSYYSVIHYLSIFSFLLLLIYLTALNNVSNTPNTPSPSEGDHMRFNESSVSRSTFIVIGVKYPIDKYTHFIIVITNTVH